MTAISTHRQYYTGKSRRIRCRFSSPYRFYTRLEPQTLHSRPADGRHRNSAPDRSKCDNIVVTAVESRARHTRFYILYYIHVDGIHIVSRRAGMVFFFYWSRSCRFRIRFHGPYSLPCPARYSARRNRTTRVYYCRCCAARVSNTDE